MPSNAATSTRGLRHRIVPMSGRDPNEQHRAASPLELLFDLTFVIALSQAGSQLAHLLAEGHIGAAIGGFGFAMFAICWAWINVSWFASAYDTDDWFFRVMTMVQMVGVMILALGLPTMFASIDEGHGLGNRVMVAGYVVIRVALICQWLRAARQDPMRRPTALTFAAIVLTAQVGWVALAIANPPFRIVLPLGLLLAAVEVVGPTVAERKSSGTPWHAHHIAERYGLLVIIAIGETLLGTVASVSALVDEHGWSVEAVVVLTAGVGLGFALWWTYFAVPSGEVLHRYRNRAWGWGYGHFFIFSSIAATGAGIHVAAYVVDGSAHVGVLAAVLATAIPVLLFSIALMWIYFHLVGERDRLHLGLFTGVVALLAAAVVLAAMGGSLGASLMLVMLAPIVVVVGYETVGHRHAADVLARVLAP